ncbi:MAG: magnesium transporter [Nanoarchaeales archaeon]|nr:magnesium transporter [Nanoarchaeales archaeon]
MSVEKVKKNKSNSKLSQSEVLLKAHQYADLVLNSDSPLNEFFLVPIKKQGRVFLYLSNNLQLEFGESFKIEDILIMFKHLDPDEITDFLQHLPKDKHLKVSKKLDEHLKEKVEYLLKFDPKSAAGLMSFDYIIIQKTSELKTLYDKLKKAFKRGKRTPTVLIRDKENHLIGYISFKHFILNRPKSLAEVIEPIPTIYFDEHYDDVVKAVNNSEHKNLVVVDYENHILGIIDVSDLLKVIEEEKTSEVYNLAGVQKEEDILDSAFAKFKSRYKWLILNLFTAFMAAGVIAMFEDTLSKLILLAVYMPIVAGMGGNAATQTLAVVVRGLSVHEIDFKNKISVVKNEIIAGVMNGCVNGFIVALIAWGFNDMPMLGLVVGISMVINLFVAGFFGTILPFVLDRFDIDPAVAATVFVTTATDIFGFFVFLGLAEIMLL